VSAISEWLNRERREILLVCKKRRHHGLVEEYLTSLANLAEILISILPLWMDEIALVPEEVHGLLTKHGTT